MRWSGEVEFDFVGDEAKGSFVATAKVVPMLTQLLAGGDVEGAMRLYEGCDAAVAEQLIEQAPTLSSVSQKNLAQMFALARDFGSAARILEGAKRLPDAAELYEKGGDYPAAARCYEKAGETAKAAAAFERAGRPDAALALYQRAGPSDALAECLARQGRHWEAAQVFGRMGNVRGEVEMLRLVPTTDPNRVPAVKRLGDLLERHGHLGMAAQLLVETLQQLPKAQDDQELLGALVRRMEALGKHDHAERVRAFAHKQLSGRAGDAKALPAASQAAPPRPSPGAGPLPVAPRAGAATIQPDEVVRGGPIPSDPFDGLVDPFGGPADRGPRGTPDAYAHLKAIPIFGELALADMKDLYRICEPVQHGPGATLIEQGAQGAGLTVIVQGSVQVLKVEGGRTSPLATLGAGSWVGEISLVDEAPTSARVVAQGPVRALFVSRQRFQQFLYTHEAAALRIWTLFTKTLAERLRQANRRS